VGRFWKIARVVGWGALTCLMALLVLVGIAVYRNTRIKALMAIPIVVNPSAASAKRSLTVPLTPMKPQLGQMVSVSINGVGPFRLLVDTGASVSILTRESLSRLKKDEYSLQSFSPGAMLFGTLWKERVYPRRFTVGKLQISTMHFVLVPRETFYGMGAFRLHHVDGILGADYLSNFAVEFDNTRQCLTLYPEGYVPAETRATAGYRWAVPLTPWKNNQHFLADLRIGESAASFSLLVDTGSDVTLLQETLLEPHARKTKRFTTSKTVYGDGRYTLYIAEKVRLGEWQRDWVRLWGTPEVPGADDVGILGMDFLSTTRLLLDFPAQRLYIAPQKN
jgi:predicted aspartyl protease